MATSIQITPLDKDKEGNIAKAVTAVMSRSTVKFPVKEFSVTKDEVYVCVDNGASKDGLSSMGPGKACFKNTVVNTLKLQELVLGKGNYEKTVGENGEILFRLSPKSTTSAVVEINGDHGNTYLVPALGGANDRRGMYEWKKIDSVKVATGPSLEGTTK